MRALNILPHLASQLHPNAGGAARLAAALVLLFSVSAAASRAQSRAATILDAHSDLSIVRLLQARSADYRAAHNGRLAVTFLPAEWPHIEFRPAAPWDWHAGGALIARVGNPGNGPVQLGIRVDDDPAADGYRHCRTAATTLAPHQTALLALPLGGDPMDVGMRAVPGPPGAKTLQVGGEGPFHTDHIVAFQFFLHSPAAPTTISLYSVVVGSPADLTGIVDRYGQYTRAEWPGKVHSDSDLTARRTQEVVKLRATRRSDLDRFGGWIGGPQFRATGFFRTELRNGVWWLVTPDGHPFFSNGVDCVGTEAQTFITGRERMFSWLPSAGDPLAAHFGTTSFVHSGPVRSGKTFNFYAANLERRYGQDWSAEWPDVAIGRLLAWGFNTIGNWSDGRVVAERRVPYVVTLGVGGDHKRVSSGEDYWGTMHDPFDPAFASDAHQSIRAAAMAARSDPWCLGYFVDNELSWGGWGDDASRYRLAVGALGADAAESPAKRALVAQLKAKYSAIQALNGSWHTAFESWDVVDRPTKPPAQLDAAARSDLGAFVKRFAEEYFRTIRDALKAADPNHLYLGCRFAWRTPEAVAAAGEYCDVVSFNIYAPRLDRKEWGFAASLGKPCIIGEYHFGALDRGMFHPGLVAAPDQAGRAALFEDYVRSVASNPAFVGCHWFQYLDEPLTGRYFDGENYNIGLVDVTDTPYPELTAAAERANGRVYEWRLHAN